MNRFHYLVLAAGVASAATAFGEEKVTRSEQTVTRTTSQDGNTKVTRTVTTTETTYVDRVRTVYSSIGLPDPTIDRIIVLERRLYEAYVARDWPTVRRIRMEIRDILTPEQVTKVYTYFQSNPLPADIAPIATYTFIPEQQFQTYVVKNESGRIEPGTLQIPGVAPTARIERSGDVDVDVNTNRVAPGEIRTSPQSAPDVNINRTSPEVNTDTNRTRINGTETRTETPTDRPGPNSSELQSNPSLNLPPSAGNQPNASGTSPDASSPSRDASSPSPAGSTSSPDMSPETKSPSSPSGASSSSPSSSSGSSSSSPSGSSSSSSGSSSSNSGSSQQND